MAKNSYISDTEQDEDMAKHSYQYRPAKTIERLMMVDAFRMLHPFESVKDYRYIGFGALEFIDFRLIYRLLGISHMISIEKDLSNRDRYDFNKPYNCIEMIHGMSWDQLRKIPWDRRSIVWLDYVSGLVKGVLADLKVFIEKAEVGSVLAVTLNANTEGKGQDQPAEERFDKERKLLQEALGPDQVPELALTDFRGWQKADLYRTLLGQQIWRLLDAYRSTLHMEQFLYFQYRESARSARMITVAWLLHDDSAATRETIHGLKTLPFYRPDTEPFLIKVPLLTHKERFAFEGKVPYKGGRLPKWARREDFDLFRLIHRYYPAFVRAEL